MHDQAPGVLILPIELLQRSYRGHWWAIEGGREKLREAKGGAEAEWGLLLPGTRASAVNLEYVTEACLPESLRLLSLYESRPQFAGNSKGNSAHCRPCLLHYTLLNLFNSAVLIISSSLGMVQLSLVGYHGNLIQLHHHQWTNTVSAEESSHYN